MTSRQHDLCAQRTVQVKKGKWNTVQTFFNAKGTAYFTYPAGARIKVRYGLGFAGWNRQTQTLDGITPKKLSVSSGSLVRARMQVRVDADTTISMDVCPEGLFWGGPKVRF